MQIQAVAIFRYPVKGLAGNALAEATLEPDHALPGDRRFGIARGGADAGGAPRFLSLTRHPRLATLAAAFDAATSVLTISRAGRPVARGDITAPAGRATIEQFFSAYMARELQGPARLYDACDDAAPGAVAGAFTDTPQQAVHILNLASVRDLERVTGTPIDARRFRANIHIDVAPAWCELASLGSTVAIGAARLLLEERTERCAATNVNPDTAERDLNIPLALKRGFGHLDMGVYGRVVTGGRIVAG
ncbi:MAG: MOSC domain-containing protein [Alphaproteobacteria bacterium]